MLFNHVYRFKLEYHSHIWYNFKQFDAKKYSSFWVTILDDLKQVGQLENTENEEAKESEEQNEGG